MLNKISINFLKSHVYNKTIQKAVSILCSNDLLSEKDMNITACHEFFMSALRKKFAYKSAKILVVQYSFPFDE